MSDPNIGRILGKRYQLQELIGSGAMGQVYRAKDTLLGGVPVAVKFLSLSVQNEKMRLQERFQTEARTCALLGQRSIHIVRVMDYGVDETYYVMEYLQGESLSGIIRQKNLSLPRFLSFARQIGLGLQCAHDGIPVDGKICPIIHRDIKPSNMMVIQDQTFGELVKVLDFGIAKLVMSDGDHTKFFLGTLAYSSPEQIEGQELDSRSDIYSFGVMMFEMLTGKMPLVPATNTFGAWYKSHTFDKPRTLAEAEPEVEVPKAVEDVIMRCLAKKSSDRPQSIREIIDIFSEVEKKINVNHPNKTGFSSHQSSNLQPQSVRDSSITGIRRNIKTELLNSSVNTNAGFQLSAIEDDITKIAVWPKTKPIADIVFLQPIHHKNALLPALWVMLPQEEIKKRLVCTRYNQFLFISFPHPIILWITVIYTRQHGAKWLPYYLDLKSNFGQEMTKLLQQTGQYRLLFFTREAPNSCTHILPSSIAAPQRERLQEWLQSSNLSASSTDVQVSKNILKQEYEKIKPKILAKLDSLATGSSFDLSG